MLRFLLALALLIPFHAQAQMQLPMGPNQWVVSVCGGVAKPTAITSGGIQYVWHQAPGCIGSFSFSFKKPVAVIGTLTSNVAVQADTGVTFSAADYAQGNTYPTPCTTRQILYSAGWDKRNSCLDCSNCTSRNLRWYASSATDVDPLTGANIPPTAFPLANGSATLSVPVSFPNAAHHWTNVCGEENDLDQAHIDAFNAAMSSVVRVDEGMGCGYFDEHGATASGNAVFQLQSFGWQ